MVKTILQKDWKYIQLREIANKCTAKNRDFTYSLVLTNSAQYGIIPQSEHFDKDIAVDENIDGYFIVNDGDFVYNPRISIIAPCGPIRKNHLGKTGVMSPLYTVFKLNNKDIDDTFFEYYFLSSAWYRYIKTIANYGARHDRMSFTDDGFFAMPVPLPPLPEQQAIAKILTETDKLIALKERLIAAKQKQKQWILQRVMADNRWEKVRFDKMFDRLNRKNSTDNTNVLTISAQYGLISQVDFFNKNIASNNLSSYYLLYKGDFVYNKSYSTGYNFGAFKRLTNYDNGVVSPLYICFSPSKENSCPDFYTHYFESSLLDREIKVFAQEGARNHGLLNISIDDFFAMKIPLPPLSEQKAIANVLTAADREIELLNKELEQQKLVKKYLMRQLLMGKIRVKGV